MMVQNSDESFSAITSKWLSIPSARAGILPSYKKWLYPIETSPLWEAYLGICSRLLLCRGIQYILSSVTYQFTALATLLNSKFVGEKTTREPNRGLLKAT